MHVLVFFLCDMCIIFKTVDPLVTYIVLAAAGVTPADLDAYVAAVLVAAQPKKSVTVAGK